MMMRSMLSSSVVDCLLSYMVVEAGNMRAALCTSLRAVLQLFVEMQQRGEQQMGELKQRRLELKKQLKDLAEEEAKEEANEEVMKGREECWRECEEELRSAVGIRGVSRACVGGVGSAGGSGDQGCQQGAGGMGGCQQGTGGGGESQAQQVDGGEEAGSQVVVGMRGERREFRGSWGHAERGVEGQGQQGEVD